MPLITIKGVSSSLIPGDLQNPSITADCGNFITGRSYCVEAPAGGHAPTTTTSPSATTTSTGNGVTTPTPTQAEMVDNCNKFHFVKPNENCDAIAKTYSITRAQFISYNPSVGDTCSGMWGSVYVCVGIIGGSPTTTPSPTSTGNGIATPTPTQPEMVDNCDAFHLVKPNENCDAIAKIYGITRAQFVSYNPSVGDNCSGMWGSVYVCVSLIGSEPVTSTSSQKPTSTGNGIATPTPTQPEMITDCNKFYFVKSGDTCASIASANNLSQTQFRNYNPSVGTDCTGLWLNAYVCIGKIGTTPTPTPTRTTLSTTTKTGNGITTPTPTQDGMVSNCNKFHFVTTTTTCQSILNQYKITLAQFTKWNPAVGSGCNSLWANTHACVGVIS